MAQFKTKTFTIADGEVILTQDDTEAKSQVQASGERNIVSIASQVSPSAGSFAAYAELVEYGGFFAIPVIGVTPLTNVIQGVNVGADAADGDVQAWSFSGNPNRIKIVETGIVGVTSVDVVVTQNA